jgi:hypothetical protein
VLPPPSAWSASTSETRVSFTWADVTLFLMGEPNTSAIGCPVPVHGVKAHPQRGSVYEGVHSGLGQLATL